MGKNEDARRYLKQADGLTLGGDSQLMTNAKQPVSASNNSTETDTK
jgi:hypothetical protein